MQIQRWPFVYNYNTNIVLYLGEPSVLFKL